MTSGYPYSSNKQTEEAGATKSLRVPQPHDLTWLFVVDQLQSAGLRIVSSPEDTKVGAAQCVCCFVLATVYTQSLRMITMIMITTYIDVFIMIYLY